ncbi:hypothetical protein YSA_05274 [Pseudomonas putida ND6]|uniref:Uncharacterized protein n=1 Tax=Pseudomonas putida ND6 TaxID=231023 RepID=I3UVV4_PSEPU|nr:hypothetical protein YSA_05274 [Pseudomonas putida ND6]
MRSLVFEPLIRINKRKAPADSDRGLLYISWFAAAGVTPLP